MGCFCHALPQAQRRLGCAGNQDSCARAGSAAHLCAGLEVVKHILRPRELGGEKW